jgi:hypothetical protein
VSEKAPRSESPSLAAANCNGGSAWRAVCDQASAIFSRVKASSTATARSLRTWTQSSYRSVQARKIKAHGSGGEILLPRRSSVRGSEGFVSVWLYTFPESIARSKLLSFGSGWMARGEKIAVDLPLPFFFSKNEKLVVGFLDRSASPAKSFDRGKRLS